MMSRQRLLLILGMCLELAGQPGVVAQNRKAVPVTHNFKISGTVVGATNDQPLAGAEITIYVARTNHLSQRFVTEADGHFVFANVQQGKYLLMASKGGYPQQSFQGHGQYSTAVAAGPGVISEDLVFRMHLGASITGTLLDDQNEPIRDAEVRLFRSEPETGVPLNAFVENTTPDDRGQYRFSKLSPGRYFIAVSSMPWYASLGSSTPTKKENRSSLDMAYSVTYYGGSTEESAATPIVVKEGDHATADIALFPVPSIRLRIRTHAPGASGVQVRQQVFSTLINTAESAQVNGTLEIHGLAPGRYQVFQSGGEQQSGSERTLDLTGDLEIDRTEAPTQAQVRGVVTAGDGLDHVPGGTAIRLSNVRSGLEFDARVSLKREFQFEGNLLPGLYSISFVGGLRIVLGTVTATGATVTGHTVEIRENSPAQLTVNLSPGLQVDGIAQREGKPISGAMIILVPNHPGHNLVLFRRDQSDSDGTFSLYNVLPGTYTLLALENAWNLEWANPAVLGPFLKRGKVVQVRTDGSAARVTIEAQ